MWIVAIVAIGIITFFFLRKKKSRANNINNQGESEPELNKNKETERRENVTIVINGKKTKGVVVYMAEGVQVFDEDGNIMIDVTDTICNSLGRVTIDGKTAGSIKDPIIKKNRAWAATIYPDWTPQKAEEGYYIYKPIIEIQDGEIKYTYEKGGAGGMSGFLYWGLY